MDFYEFSSKSMGKLNATETKLLDYVLGHMDELSHMNIRTMSRNCYVSTATVFRFVKKLGFAGFSEFIEMVGQSNSQILKPAEVPQSLANKEYMQEYLKNIIEGVRVIRPEQIQRFLEALDRNPRVYLIGQGLGLPVACYCDHLFTAFGYDTYRPEEEFEFRATLARVQDNDLCIFFSYSGNNQKISQIIQYLRANTKAFLVSITRADNNLVQSMSDLNFYIFADQLTHGDIDITSRISMIAVIEDLLYSKLRRDGETKLRKL